MIRKNAVPFYRDIRILKYLWQVGFGLLVIGGFVYLFNNMTVGLQKQGVTLGLSFMKGIASFDIGEQLIPFARTDSYIRAFFVGILNTLFVSVVSIFFATILGFVIGISRLSNNWLVKNLSTAYLEIFRNFSLLVFLMFWYLGVFLKLPKIQDSIIWFNNIYLTNRGVAIPWIQPGATYQTYLLILIGTLIFSVGLSKFLRLKFPHSSGFGRFWAAVIFFSVIALIIYLFLSPKPFTFESPYITDTKIKNLKGGIILSPEFMALATGLILYTAAFIGEIVRAGILSVSKGQFEAAKALGFNNWLTLRLIVVPQALKVVIPPLTSQYLNIIKNSSLGIAIGYSDVFYISSTIINQSGHAVEAITLVMITYLVFSLSTSIFMNWYNKKNKLVER